VIGYGKRAVKMELVQASAFAIVCGLTASGVVASLLELAAGTRVRFREPHVSRSRPVISAARVVAAGPFMLGNEALAAWRDGRISLAALFSCGATAIAWCFAMGLVLLGIAVELASGPATY